jgi:hypothetical protein
MMAGRLDLVLGLIDERLDDWPARRSITSQRINS